MSRFVFVLGAGASAAAKAPLASNFMDKARLLLRSGDLPETDVSAFSLVFKARDALKAAHSKAALDLSDLEVLFGAFEMAALFGRLGSLSDAEVEGLPAAMRRLISRTVERSMEFPVLTAPLNAVTPRSRAEWRTGTFPKILPPNPYDLFVELLNGIAKGRPHDVAVITFNYDLGMDHALYFTGTPYNYGLEQDTKGGIDLLKLHGSLNWGRCPRCKVILPLELERCVKGVPIRSAESVKMEVSQRLSQLEHCGFPLAAEPVIVPPTWNKGTYHTQLNQVWKKAARQLSGAEYIFIIGYSYPPTDEFFRYLYALGSIGEGWLEKIIVFNPDAKAGERIGSLLGPLARGRFTALTNDFEQAITYLERIDPS
jgi:hypothetical protein